MSTVVNIRQLEAGKVQVGDDAKLTYPGKDGKYRPLVVAMKGFVDSVERHYNGRMVPFTNHYHFDENEKRTNAVGSVFVEPFERYLLEEGMTPTQRAHYATMTMPSNYGYVDAVMDFHVVRQMWCTPTKFFHVDGPLMEEPLAYLAKKTLESKVRRAGVVYFSFQLEPTADSATNIKITLDQVVINHEFMSSIVDDEDMV